MSAHDSEMKVWDKSQQEQRERDAISKQAESLIKQGKYEEAGRVFEKFSPSMYPPYQALVDSLHQQQKELDDRQRGLADRRRKITIQIQTNRTPTTTAPALAPKLAGTRAGQPFFRENRSSVGLRIT